ncbi:MAG: hypothetical protein JNM86_11610 [Phycisphaerae bacterium]|nr:hypothetical protein [Phycisphaerae bacterium]
MPATDPRKAPEQFFRAVRVRRRRVLATRAVAAMTFALVAGIGVWLVRPAPAPRVFSPVQLVFVSKGPPALRRLRELPPEIEAGPAPVEATRVGDARDPERISGFGGM